MTHIEALKLAREALTRDGWKKTGDAIRAIDEALAQPQQEPVAWVIWLHGPAGIFDHKQFAELEFERRNGDYPNPYRKLLPLYTTPPQRKPLNGVLVPLNVLEAAEESLGSFCSDHGWADEDMQNMDNLSAYIAEHKAAHGIKE